MSRFQVCYVQFTNQIIVCAYKSNSRNKCQVEEARRISSFRFEDDSFVSSYEKKDGTLFLSTDKPFISHISRWMTLLYRWQLVLYAVH